MLPVSTPTCGGAADGGVRSMGRGPRALFLRGTVSPGHRLAPTRAHRVLEAGSSLGGWGGAPSQRSGPQGRPGLPPQRGWSQVPGGKLCHLPGVRHPVTTWAPSGRACQRVPLGACPARDLVVKVMGHLLHGQPRPRGEYVAGRDVGLLAVCLMPGQLGAAQGTRWNQASSRGLPGAGVYLGPWRFLTAPGGRGVSGWTPPVPGRASRARGGSPQAPG